MKFSKIEQTFFLISLVKILIFVQGETSHNLRFPRVPTNSFERLNFNSSRQSKLFPLFSIVRVSNSPCVPELADTIGTCFTRSQCVSAGGIASGSCAAGFGVCCVVTATCDATVSQNNTIFRNRDYPSVTQPTALEVCTVRIQKPSANVCQLHLNFTVMQLASTDDQGLCMVDRLTINGVTSSPSNLCGTLTGQHMYLDYGSSDRITLSVIVDGAASQQARTWSIKMKYIECNSLARAPEGCLQYYTSTSEEVRMLGYPMIPHLAELDYTICVRNEDDSGSIVWAPCPGQPTTTSFAMTGDPATPAAGSACNTDYVLIMTDDTAATTPKTDDRYCGTSLIAPTSTQLVRSIGHPYIMRVKSDSTEPTTDVSNSGFCLAFRQEPPSRG